MKYILNIDWLEFRGKSSINLEEMLEKRWYTFNNGVSIELNFLNKTLKGSSSCFFKVFYYEDEVAELETKSLNLSKTSGIQNIWIKIKNHVFYLQDYSAITNIIIHALEITNIVLARVDICYDTDADILGSFKKMYSNDKSFDLKNRNRYFINGTGKHDPTIYIGSLKSKSKCISIYNKTKEISQNQKEYIRNLHNKKFRGQPIYRLELKLLRKTIDSVKMDIDSLGDMNYIKSVFRTLVDAMIFFTDNQTKKKIELVNLNATGISIKQTLKRKTPGNNIKKMKEVINIIDKELKSYNKAEVRKAYNIVKNRILFKYKLQIWYSLKK